ncbi:MAG: prolyl oligopeptidase family serine peptidase [Clostridia bacterium]|nr:prolyl oligopeptidase family serine peptidase [Clostridia bacterium]
MNKLITYENLRCFTYSNDKILKGEPRGIVLDFFGLGGQEMFDEDTGAGKMFAEKGIIFLVPYNNPWAWMNRQAVDYTDEIVRVILDHYALPDSTPIVSTGGSMGGLSALVYTRYARITPVCCVANCPVCDLPYHFTERHDLPRTLYSAFYNIEGDVSEALKCASPLHLVDTMPRVPYKIFHCDNDGAVNIEKHSERFVSAMTEAGHDVEYRVVNGRQHCDLTEDEWGKYYACAEKAIIG